MVGTGYQINAFDNVGKAVTNLKTDVTITIPYDPAELEKSGLKPQDLKIAFYDETDAVWKQLKASVVNEKEKTVSAVVDHLTRFAIVAAADIVPPAPPAEVKVSALGDGKIKLAWANPAKDFSHAKIYRSDKQAELGSIRASEIFATEFTDEGVTNGSNYYYTVRAVAPAGNESGNKEQANIIAKGTSAVKKLIVTVGKKTDIKVAKPAVTAVTGALTRNLKRGLKGDDIKVLQQFLADNGFYPEKIINGTFGPAVQRAVIRFQEKYASETLTPAGLKKGNGFVGALARKKINELMGK